MNNVFRLLCFLSIVGLALACGGSDSDPSTGPDTTNDPPAVTDQDTPTDTGDMSTDTGDTPTDTSSLPPAFAHFTEAVDVRLDGDVVVLESTGIPNHPSPYFDRNDANYTAPHDGMQVNPNRILEQNLTLRLPLNPQIASQPTETDLGAIGVAVNGVALFNQYAGRNSTGWLPLENEIETFDIYNGHPQQRGMYHYHLEPLFLTQDSQSKLMGFLSDGFPVYGPRDLDGSLPNDLDECNGHSGTVADYEDDIYHYHITAAFPYISGCYKGTPGTVSN